MAEKNRLTEEGKKVLEQELEELKVNRRRDVAEKLKVARAQGDLSENAEYDAAKDEQREIEARIEEIEDILKHAEIGGGGIKNFGCYITILDIEFDEEMEYKIVGSQEANSSKGKISDESPLGRALGNAKKGQIIEVEAPAGMIQYKVIDISKEKKAK